jgi:hypothetical protein
LRALLGAHPILHISGIRLNVLTKFYSSDQIEKNEMGWAYSTYGKSTGAYRVSVGKPERNIPLGRPRPRWEDNIKMEL